MRPAIAGGLEPSIRGVHAPSPAIKSAGDEPELNLLFVDIHQNRWSGVA